jgi:acetyltransferase
MSTASTRPNPVGYPESLEHQVVLADATPVLLRPVRPEDAQAQRRFVARLSDLTLYRRFHGAVRELTPERLRRFTQIDYDREMAFVAIDHSGADEEIRAFAQYHRVPGTGEAEFGIAVEDSWQGHGLGLAMMAAIESCAVVRGIARLFGYVLAENETMRGMMAARGYRAERDPDDYAVIRYVRELAPQAIGE